MRWWRREYTEEREVTSSGCDFFGSLVPLSLLRLPAPEKTAEDADEEEATLDEDDIFDNDGLSQFLVESSTSDLGMPPDQSPASHNLAARLAVANIMVPKSMAMAMVEVAALWVGE